jgi:riboflavin kinase/FMN adenylyltransferase
MGRTIGFPTANISIRRKLSPVLGVYSVITKINGTEYIGICNVGKRPTIGGTKVLLEVFIFNFNQEIYGEHVTVIFKQKCRDEVKFNSLDELKSQIKKDVAKSKKYFQSKLFLD